MSTWKLSGLLLTTLLSTTPALSETASTLAEFPAGTFLENLTASENGDLTVTSYFGRELLRLNAENVQSTFATLEVHPVSILSQGDGYLIAAHGTSFTEGPSFTRTQQLLHLDSTGAVIDTITMPDALFLNGMTALPDGRVLIADSIAGKIWVYDPKSKSVAAWLKHETLAQNPDLPSSIPGVNGLKLDGDRLLMSNSGRGAIYTVFIKDGEPSSDIEMFAQTGPIDDFWIDGDRVIFTTHAEKLLAVDPNGNLSTLLAGGCDGCTAVTKRGRSYIVLTTGGMLEGKAKPARVLELPAE